MSEHMGTDEIAQLGGEGGLVELGPPPPAANDDSMPVKRQPRLTRFIRKTDADGDAAQFKGRLVRRKGYTP